MSNNKIEKDNTADIKVKILVIDDDKSICESFYKVLTPEGYYVAQAFGGSSAIEKIKKDDFDIAFIDLKMPDVDGLEVLRAAKKIKPNTDLVMITGFASVESSVEAMKIGALDYIVKPFTSSELKQFTDEALQKRRERIIQEEEREGFRRFTLSERIQHLLLIMCFFILALTGLPLVFPNAPIIKSVFFFSDSSMLRGLIHRIGAAILLALGVYHIGYCMISEQGNRDLRKIIPRKQDLKDAWLALKYNLRISKDYPKFDKFNFAQRLEYFGVVWGVLIMGITGLLLWFEEATLSIFPLWVIDLARVIHRYEAILAILTIMIWHMYHVHLNAEVFPMSKVWLTGKLSRQEMIRHHPLEYTQLTGRRVEEQEVTEHRVIKLKDVSN